MYGLEKKSSEKFAFDLEKQIKEGTQKKKVLENIEKRIHEMKKHLREGASEKEFDTFELLLQGYSALKRVIQKIK